MKEQIKQGKYQGLCIHTISDDDNDIEKNIVMLTWFEKFADQFSDVGFKDKVSKPRIFEAFCNAILSSQNNQGLETLTKLKEFVRQQKESLMPIQDYRDFANVNKSLALKQKKKDKLLANEIKGFRLEVSDDSSEAEEEQQLSPQKVETLLDKGTEKARRLAQLYQHEEGEEALDEYYEYVGLNPPTPAEVTNEEEEIVPAEAWYVSYTDKIQRDYQQPIQVCPPRGDKLGISITDSAI